MGNLFVQETVINKTKNCMIWESGVRDTHVADKNSLFRSMELVYGKYVRPVILITEDGRRRKIGWIFEKNERYGVSGSFLKQTKVTLHRKKPDVKVIYHYV